MKNGRSSLRLPMIQASLVLAFLFAVSSFLVPYRADGRYGQGHEQSQSQSSAQTSEQNPSGQKSSDQSSPAKSPSSAESGSNQSDQQSPGIGKALAKETRESEGETGRACRPEALNHGAEAGQTHRLSVHGAHFRAGHEFRHHRHLTDLGPRKSVPGVFRKRNESIQKAFEEARKASAEAGQPLWRTLKTACARWTSRSAECRPPRKKKRKAKKSGSRKPRKTSCEK